MSQTVSTETKEVARIESARGNLAIRMPDNSVLPLHGQLVRILEHNEFGWKVRPEPRNFPEDAYPNAWWLEADYFSLKKE
jgi:hypothetical protein